jgi:hypothetical protein
VRVASRDVDRGRDPHDTHGPSPSLRRAVPLLPRGVVSPALKLPRAHQRTRMVRPARHLEHTLQARHGHRAGAEVAAPGLRGLRLEAASAAAVREHRGGHSSKLADHIGAPANDTPRPQHGAGMRRSCADLYSVDYPFDLHRGRSLHQRAITELSTEVGPPAPDVAVVEDCTRMMLADIDLHGCAAQRMYPKIDPLRGITRAEPPAPPIRRSPAPQATFRDRAGSKYTSRDVAHRDQSRHEHRVRRLRVPSPPEGPT